MQRFKDTVQSGQTAPFLITVELLIMSLATGIQDATSFPDYHCFASNQTGNTVLLAVAAAGLQGESFDTRNVCVSLGVFLGSGLVMGQIGNVAGSRKRWWLLLTNLLSTALMFGAAGVQYAILPEEPENGPIAMGVVALLAFSSGAQVASCRPLDVPQITTAMATAAWVDLVVDPNLAKLKNYQRDRRSLFLTMLTLGSFAGAYAKSGVNSSLALCLCAILKLIATCLFLFNPREQIATSPLPP